MAIQRVTQTGLLGNLKSAIIAVPIGILLFLASFIVLFKGEGRTNWAKVAEDSVAVEASAASGHDGEFVSVTGELVSAEQVGDPTFVAPGNFLSLSRNVEVYVWVQHTETETRDKVGGGTETITTYTYAQEWSSSIPDSSRFEDTSYRGRNPGTQMVWSDESFSVNAGTVGAWSFTMADIRDNPVLSAGHGLPSGSTVSPSTLTLQGAAAEPTATVAGDHVYLSGASPTNPLVGDYRVSFSALVGGQTVTMFGKAEGGALVPWPADGEKTMLRAVFGDREAAIASLLTEYKMAGWAFRIGGFLMMWIGMSMVFAPLHAMAGILPFLKKGTEFLVGCFTFIVAAVLTTITVVVSMILHSWVAMLVVTLLFGGLVVLLFTMRKKGDTPAAQMQAPPGPPPGAEAQQGWGPPPGGMPPGPPPGGMPPGPPPA